MRQEPVQAEIHKPQPPLRIVLAGGSGHVGKLLEGHFRLQGHSVRVLSRKRRANASNVVWWDGQNPGDWMEELSGADVLINLAGRSVDCRYTAVHRQEILRSRVRSTQLLGQAINRVQDPPRIWLNASTATLYRHALDKEMDDLSGEIGGTERNVPRSWNFSIEVAKRWEEAFWSSETQGIQKVALRSAMVMSPDRGGVFDALLRLVRFGLGGRIGKGNQYVSWIHEADFARAIDHLIHRGGLYGAVNIASPRPVPNAEFMRTLRNAWGRSFGIATPKPILEVGAFLLRTESELVLKSRRVVPRRLLEDGFRFQFLSWPEAVRDLVARRKNGPALTTPVPVLPRSRRNEAA